MKTLIVGMMFLVGCAGPANSEQPYLYEGELPPYTEYLQINEKVDGNTFYKPLLTFSFEDVSGGDIIHVISEVQYTNDCGVNVGVTDRILFIDDEGDIHQNLNLMGDRLGSNVTPGMHHDCRTRSLYFTIPFNAKQLDVVFQARAYSDATDDIINVDRLRMQITFL